MNTKEEIGIVDIEAFEEALEEEANALEAVRAGRWHVDIEKKTIRVPTWNRNGYTRAPTAEEISAAEDREWKERAQ